MWWHMPIVFALGKWRREDERFEASLIYILTCRWAWATETLYHKQLLQSKIILLRGHASTLGFENHLLNFQFSSIAQHYQIVFFIFKFLKHTKKAGKMQQILRYPYLDSAAVQVFAIYVSSVYMCSEVISKQNYRCHGVSLLNTSTRWCHLTLPPSRNHPQQCWELSCIITNHPIYCLIYTFIPKVFSRKDTVNNYPLYLVTMSLTSSL